MNHRIYLGLGSNQGDRERHLSAARGALPPAVRVLHSSPIYETEPWGYEHQPRFLNQVLEAETRLRPISLLKYLKALERDLGREATFRYGPRVIDIDILLYDRAVMRTERLVLPHPALHERAFVLVPLADLAPELLHPTIKRTVAELLDELDSGESSGVQRYASESASAPSEP